MMMMMRTMIGSTNLVLFLLVYVCVYYMRYHLGVVVGGLSGWFIFIFLILIIIILMRCARLCCCVSIEHNNILLAHIQMETRPVIWEVSLYALAVYPTYITLYTYRQMNVHPSAAKPRFRYIYIYAMLLRWWTFFSIASSEFWLYSRTTVNIVDTCIATIYTVLLLHYHILLKTLHSVHMLLL